MKTYTIILAFISFAIKGLSQPNCSQTSTGMIPINDLGAGTYNGWTGGLYPGSSNYMPLSHKNAGLFISSQVQPIDTNGIYDPVNGRIVWLSIGMSNTTAESQSFIPMAYSLPNLNPQVTLVDGAVGGKPAREISNPTLAEYTVYWNTVYQRLNQAGVSPNQVQVIWYKTDNPAGTTPLQEHFDSLLIQSKRIMNEIKTRFPNARLCYVASRIYGGYASTNLNPEPYAYQNGWTMKRLIEDQINGDTLLQYSGTNINSPWLSWGIYQWADGTTPRSDGLTWLCPDDYQNDGTHPSPIGRQKVAGMLLDFFQTDSTACPWFLTNCSLTSVDIQYDSKNSIGIFPNPFNNLLTVTFIEPFRNSKITVYNSLGQIITVVDNIRTSSVTIDLSELKNQLLFVSIHSDGKFETRAIVKE